MSFVFFVVGPPPPPILRFFGIDTVVRLNIEIIDIKSIAELNTKSHYRRSIIVHVVKAQRRRENIFIDFFRYLHLVFRKLFVDKYSKNFEIN